jgi:chemotaxis-related protein WspB
MLLLILQVAGDRYALDAREIVEVLPMVAINPLPLSADGVAGVIDYRGASVPVVDLSQSLYGHPTQSRLSTRIVIVGHPDGRSRLVALLVERATETMRRETTDFMETGVSSGAPTARLASVTRDTHGLVQWFDLARLFAGHDEAVPPTPRLTVEAHRPVTSR